MYIYIYIYIHINVSYIPCTYLLDALTIEISYSKWTRLIHIAITVYANVIELLHNYHTPIMHLLDMSQTCSEQVYRILGLYIPITRCA